MKCKFILVALFLFLSDIGISNAQGYKIYQNDNQKYGIKDSNGKIVVQPKYDDMGEISEGLVPVMVTEFIDYFFDYEEFHNWGVVNVMGKEIVSPMYEDILPYSEGLAAFQEKNLWGFLDSNGHVVINPVFSSVGQFNGGKVAVVLNGKSFYINKQGEKIE